MKKILMIAITFSLMVSLSSYSQTETHHVSFTKLDKIVAIVNRETITLSALNKEIARFQNQLEHMQQPVPPQAELKKMVLDNLIAKSLQLQLAKANNIVIPESDVNKTMENIAKENKITVAQLQEAVKQTGLSAKEYTNQIRDQLTVQKIQQEQVSKNINFTPEDVKNFVKENKAKLNRYNAYHVIDIVLPVSDNSAQARAQAYTLMQQLKKTQDVDSLLKQYPSAENNDLGWRPLGEYPGLFQSRIASLQINAVSDPIQAPNGFHILKLIEARGESQALTENDLKNLAFQQKAQQTVKEWITKLRKEAYVKVME